MHVIKRCDIFVQFLYMRTSLRKYALVEKQTDILEQLFSHVCDSFMVKTVLEATQMFAVVTHERQIS